MGGIGSGNRCHWWRPSKKQVVERCRTLEADRWTREGLLRPGVHLAGSWQWQTSKKRTTFCLTYEVRTTTLTQAAVRLTYSLPIDDGTRQDSVDYTVGLTTTRQRFGGVRWWFTCPLIVRGVACKRRVGKLYLPPGGRYFGCRHCHRLSYTSCQESRKDDALGRLIAGNLGCDLRAVKRIMRRFGK